MDCCGHAHLPLAPAWMSGLTLASIGAMPAREAGPPGSTQAARSAETASAALEVLRRNISVDVHSHGGKTGITSKAPPSNDLAKRNARGIAGRRLPRRRPGRSDPGQKRGG